MKPFRTSRTVKSPQCRSPSRKVQSSRKLGPIRSTHLVSSASRSMTAHSAENMKRPGLSSSVFPSRSSKPYSSSRFGSFGSPQSPQSRKSHQPAFSMDRNYGLKRGGYDKKHQFPQSHSDVRVMTEERSPIKMPRTESLGYNYVSKKKPRRDEVHFRQSATLSSPVQGSPSNRQKSQLHLPPESHHHGHPPMTSYHRSSDPKYPTSFLPDQNDKNVMMFYHQRDTSAGKSTSREQAESFVARNYGLTLDERFRTVSSDSARARAEKHAHYSKEELENITVDVKRNVREYSPTVRHILDPTEVKLVRRPNEGHRPIFDRGEIRQASRDLREDAHVEQKIYSMKMSGHYSVSQKDMENYEITRHKFDTYRGPTLQTDPYSLSERWHSSGNKKNEPMHAAEKDERSRGFVDQTQTAGNLAKKYRTRTPSVDRDFRLIRNEHRSRPMSEFDVLPSTYTPQNDTKEIAGRRGSDKFKSTWHSPPPGPQRFGISSVHNKGRSGDLPDHVRSSREPWMNERYNDKVERPLVRPSSRERSKYYFDDSFERPKGPPMYKNDVRDAPRGARAFSSRGSFRGFRNKTSRGGRISRGGAVSRVFRGKSSHQGGSLTRMRGFPSRRRMMSGSYAHRF